MSCNQPVSRNKTAATLETTKDNNDVVAGMSSSSSNSQDHPRCIIGQTQYVEEVKDHNMDLHGNSSYNSTAQHVNLAFKDDIECGIEAASVKEGGSKEASIEQGPKKEEAEEIEESSEDDDAIEFVDVREEILTMKEQFDNLMDVIDNDLFNVAEDVDEDDEDDEDIGQETESRSGSQTSILGSSRGNLLVQILSVVGIGFGHFIDGTVLAYPSPAIPSMQNSTVLNRQRAGIIHTLLVFHWRDGWMFASWNGDDPAWSSRRHHDANGSGLRPGLPLDGERHRRQDDGGGSPDDRGRPRTHSLHPHRLHRRGHQSGVQGSPRCRPQPLLPTGHLRHLRLRLLPGLVMAGIHILHSERLLLGGGVVHPRFAGLPRLQKPDESSQSRSQVVGPRRRQTAIAPRRHRPKTAAAATRWLARWRRVEC